MVILAPGGGVADTRLPDPFERIALTDLVREGGFVSGRLRTAEPVEFVGGGGGPGEPAHYAVDLRFRAAIVPAPRPTEVLTGEAARRSEQAAVAVAGLRLIHGASAAELAQLRARLHPEQPPWPGLDGDEAEAILAVARRALPSPAAFQRSIERVIVYGDDAIVVGRDSGGSVGGVGSAATAANGSWPQRLCRTTTRRLRKCDCHFSLTAGPEPGAGRPSAQRRGWVWTAMPSSRQPPSQANSRSKRIAAGRSGKLPRIRSTRG